MEKKNSKLKLSNGEETEDPKQILEEEKSFYKNLYTSKNVDPENSEFDIFFTNNLLTPVNEELSKKCEARYAFRKRVSASSKGYGKRKIAWFGLSFK